MMMLFSNADFTKINMGQFTLPLGKQGVFVSNWEVVCTVNKLQGRPWREDTKAF